MVELGWAANVAEIVGASTVLVAVLVGWMEVRQARHERRRQTARDQAEVLGSMEWARAISRVWQLPDEIPAREMGEDQELADAANFVAANLNNLGYMVNRGLIEPEDMKGLNWRPTYRMCWRKLRRFVRGTRVGAEDDMMFHWFERMAVDLGGEPLSPLDPGEDGATDQEGPGPGPS